jgi:predicted phosphodiesterase
MPSEGAPNAHKATVQTVIFPGQRLRFIATKLNSLHSPARPPPLQDIPINVVCVSDTHNTQPPIPPGDLLLHAGDLSAWGTFSEIQAQLTWLSQQPHRYKVVVAGNHDLLFDSEFCERHLERWIRIQEAHGSAMQFDGTKTVNDLDWGDLIYLQNSSMTLQFPGHRSISIYGSPLTPQYGISAFQYPSSEDVWSGRVPPNTDIILTHGPPRGHLDGLKKSGCMFLACEVARVRPQLVVYGHIHVGYGIEERVYDRVGKAYEAILGQWGTWGTLLEMVWGIVWEFFRTRIFRGVGKKTIFVNAAVVEGWEQHVVKNEAVVVQI